MFSFTDLPPQFSFLAKTRQNINIENWEKIIHENEENTDPVIMSEQTETEELKNYNSLLSSFFTYPVCRSKKSLLEYVKPHLNNKKNNLIEKKKDKYLKESEDISPDIKPSNYPQIEKLSSKENPIAHLLFKNLFCRMSDDEFVKEVKSVKKNKENKQDIEQVLVFNNPQISALT